MTKVQSKEKKQISSAFFPTEGVEQSVLLRFEKTVRLYPDNIAVKDHQASLTYRDLNNAANIIASMILERCQTKDDAPVAFLQGHNIASIISMMGILKAGRSYVALHAGNPADRLIAMLSNAKPALFISSYNHRDMVNSLLGNGNELPLLYLEDVDLSQETGNPEIYVSGNSPFTISYTSGSTGEPKGVVLCHRNVNFCNLREDVDYQVTHQDRISLVYSISFGAAYAPIMDAFYSGGTLCMYDFAKFGPEAALDWIQVERITILKVTPTMLRAMFETVPDNLVLASVRILSLGGEGSKAVDVELYKKHTSPNCRMISVFASSEAGVVTTYELDHTSEITGEFVPSGYPIPGHTVQLLDDADRPVEVGEVGEIVIESRFLHAGYWNLPELTKERFVSDPQNPDVKTLHTGDLGRWREDGALEFLGRKDSMVKIRGYRVELSEIEFHLQSHPNIQQAVVVVKPIKNRPGQNQIIAYVVSQQKENLDRSSLRNFLSTKLPDYSIPSEFVFLERFPINLHGKVDKQALPDIPERKELSATDLPTTTDEEKLVQIWKELLHLDEVGVHDDFFQLGGDSLLVLSMILKVENELHTRVPRSFFNEPTINKLSKLMNEADSQDEDFDPLLRLNNWERPKKKNKSRSLVKKLSYALNRWLRNLENPDYIFEWLLSLIVLRVTFQTARSMVFWLSSKRFVLRSIYSKERQLFIRLLNSFGISNPDLDDLFQLSFINNLLRKLIESKSPFLEMLKSAKTPKSKYSTSLEEFINPQSTDQLSVFFPVKGFQYLEEAKRLGKGVILISLHGTAANRVAIRILSRILGVDWIKTISHNTAIKPLRQKHDWIKKKNIPSAMAATIYAEEAYRGQELLLKNEVVQMLSDFGAFGPGKTYNIQVGDRLYTVKAGFAELALNTGAQIIPYFGRFTKTGQLLMEFLPPFDQGQGDRNQQIQAMVLQYAGLLNHLFTTYPSMFHWGRIRKHFRQPEFSGE